MLRKLLLVCTFVLLLSPVGTLSAQNTWEAFWDGMETALMTLGTNPTQAYFDRLYHPDLPNRERVFQSLVSEANALTDMQVTYPILIFDGARAAYQRVVTGMFTQPYVAGSTTLPPTNAPVRYVTQGIMDVSGQGRIYADYAVTDGFAKFQEFGAIPLAPGQEHGQIGLRPYNGGAADSAFVPGLSEFTHFVRASRPAARQDSETETPVTVRWFVGLGGADAEAAQAEIDAFNQAYPDMHIEMNTDFGSAEAANIIPAFGSSGDWLNLTPLIEATNPSLIDINAFVEQDNWSAYFATITLPANAEVWIPTFVDALSIPQPIQFPVFAFENLDLDAQRFQVFINMDTLAITNQLGINPREIQLADQQAAFAALLGDGAGDADLDAELEALETELETIINEESPTCSVTVIGDSNLRTGSETSYDVAGTAKAGDVLQIVGYQEAHNNLKWYRTVDGKWIRQDRVTAGEDCANLPYWTGS